MLHDLSARVKSGEPLVGAFIFLSDVGVAEVLSHAGFDFLVIDMEHSPTDFGHLRNLLMAVENRCPPVVRVRGNAPEWITTVLDLGPAAVMVPSINTAAQAQAAVQYAKYAPVGRRGIGPTRVSDYGLHRSRVLREANEKQMLWIQIEHAEAVANADTISRVPGIDLVFIGPSDLSQSCGHLDNPSHPEVLASISKAVQAIRRNHVPAGIPVGPDEDINTWRRAGFSAFVIGIDFRFLKAGAQQALDAARLGLTRGSA